MQRFQKTWLVADDVIGGKYPNHGFRILSLYQKSGQSTGRSRIASYRLLHDLAARNAGQLVRYLQSQILVGYHPSLINPGQWFEAFDCLLEHGALAIQG